MLEVDGQMIGESKAIERFVARLGGLMGANEVEAAQIDAMAEHVRDINTAYQKIRAMKDEEKEAAMAKWGDLEGVADVGLRMALSAKLADVVKHNRVHSTPTALPTDTDSQRRKPQRRRKRRTKEREEHKKNKKHEQLRKKKRNADTQEK